MTVPNVAGEPAPPATSANIQSFADVPLHGDGTSAPATQAGVGDLVATAAAAHGYTAEQLTWATPEGIDVKPVYVAADRAEEGGRRCHAPAR